MKTLGFLLWGCLLCFVFTLPSGDARRSRPRCYPTLSRCRAKCCDSGKTCESYIYKGCTWWKCVPVDCGTLSSPVHGTVSTPGGTEFGDIATYSCHPGYHLVGSTTRICLATNSWSGSAPTCESTHCAPLDDPCDGYVDTPDTTVGGVATYSCDIGFVMVGDPTRICQANGLWDGEMPCCDAESSVCPIGWDEYGSSCYYFGNGSVTWAEAREICIDFGGDLAQITSAGENAFLRNIAMIIGSGEFWLGASDKFNEGEFRWFNTMEVLEPGDFNDWNSTQPDNGGPAGEDCLEMKDIYNFHWNDDECYNPQQYICEIEL